MPHGWTNQISGSDRNVSENLIKSITPDHGRMILSNPLPDPGKFARQSETLPYGD